MITNKLIVLAIALGALVALASNAAETNKPAGAGRPEAGQRGAKMAEELNLSAEQKPKVEAVMKETNNKVKDLRNDTSLTPEQRREKAKALADETKGKLKEILTPEQMIKLEDLRKNRQGRGPGPDQSKPKPGTEAAK